MEPSAKKSIARASSALGVLLLAVGGIWLFSLIGSLLVLFGSNWQLLLRFEFLEDVNAVILIPIILLLGISLYFVARVVEKTWKEAERMDKYLKLKEAETAAIIELAEVLRESNAPNKEQ
jgi:ABC-type multidrug transport system fused ATPase/permease subunit